MLQKFALFFMAFGLSFLAEEFGWSTQGEAFVWINVGATLLLLALAIILCLFAGDGIGEKLGYSFTVVILGVVQLGVCLLATWGATKLFPVSFTVAYQIMSFGQCLCGTSKKNRD